MKKTYKPWTGVSGGPARWRRFAGKDAPQSLSPPAEPPYTPSLDPHRGWWGQRNWYTVFWTCRPRFHQLLVHFQEERHRGWTRLSVALSTQKPIIQPWALGAGWGRPLHPDALSCPGKHGCYLSVSLGLRLSTRRCLLSQVICFCWLKPALWCCNWQLVLLPSPKWEIEPTQGWALKLIRKLDR